VTCLLHLAAAGVLSLAAPQEGNLLEPQEIRVVPREGRDWFTVRAQNASALSVLREVTRLSGHELNGLDLLDRPALLTVDLSDRPIEHVLEYALGSLGLRYELDRRSITVLEGEPRSSEEHLDLATASWIRVANRFPDHPAAADARFAQAQLAELRGLDGAARSLYLTLVEDYPNAALTGEAYMRAGRISARLGQWSDASRIYRTLADLDVASEYHAAARLEWARTMVAQGDPRSAMYMLSALDANYPTFDRTELTARRLVKARALNSRELYMEALEELDLADPDFDSLGALEALQIRAVALEGIGLPGEAARAWLLYADEATGRERVFAFGQAARLSLEAEDELAVLFVVRQAEEAGVEVGLEGFERTARARLGFVVDTETKTIVDRLDQAEEWLDAEDFERAAEPLESLFLARGALDDATAARVCVAWARCLDGTTGLGPAIQALTSVRADFEDLEHRRLIDTGAARLFEAHNRFDDAIEAYQGRYAQP
jgi:tetratricopeptide (TPR) repeat protein